MARVRRFAFRHPHLATLQGAGGTAARLEVERWARLHGWPVAASPADADVVVLCGNTSGPLAPFIARVIDHVPFPRAVLDLPGSDQPSRLDALLTDARSRLLNWNDQRGLAAEIARRTADEHATEEHGGHGEHGMQAEEGGDGGGGGHGGMGMHDMDMPMEVGGLPLADRQEDRDGLKLDVLHIPFGPVLADWPPGVSLRLAVQGDVVQRAELGPPTFAHAASTGSWWDEPWRARLAGDSVTVLHAERRRAVAHLDSAARLLVLAGGDASARAARRLRDAVLSGTEAASLQSRAADLRRGVEGSRVLRRVTEGLGMLTAAHARQAGITGPALRAAGAPDDLRTASPSYPRFSPVAIGGGDVFARCVQWLAETELALYLATGPARPLEPVSGALEGTRGRIDPAGPPPSQPLAGVIPALATGQELSSVRLIVASLDPEGDDLATRSPHVHEVVHG